MKLANKYTLYLNRRINNISAGRDAPIFLHVPKTGGTYLGQLESLGRPILWPVVHVGHRVVVSEKSDLKNGYPPVGYSPRKYLLESELKDRAVFSVVRNPFDWLVSYAGHAGGWNRNYVDLSHYDYTIAKGKFEYFVKAILDRDSPWPSRKFLFFQLFSTSGKFIPTWLMRNETLDEKIGDFCSYYRLKLEKRSKQRVGRRKDYRFYYTDALVDELNLAWERELYLFGYDFDGFIGEHWLFNRPLQDEHRRLITYDYRLDNLQVKEK